MPERQKMSIPCPRCGALLFQVYADGGEPVEPALLKSDEHGNYVVCANSNCRRQVRLVQPSPGFWIPAPKRGTR